MPPFAITPLPRDAGLVRIEAQIRQAIRDTVNRNSRKPFYWGGLAGYLQLEAIGLALHQATAIDPESDYLRQLIGRVDQVLAKNHTLAEDLQADHQWLQQIADCLSDANDQNRINR